MDLKQAIEQRLGEWRDGLIEKNARLAFDSFPRELSVYRPLMINLYNDLVSNVLNHGQGSGFEICSTAISLGSGWMLGVRNTGAGKADGARPDRLQFTLGEKTA